LTFLSVLNLSNNNLAGSIPTCRQLQTFDNTSYKGNPGLCGSPLAESCSDSGTSRVGVNYMKSGTGIHGSPKSRIRIYVWVRWYYFTRAALAKLQNSVLAAD
ncbi:unnamed protein product, partial [Linum tenue]